MPRSVQVHETCSRAVVLQRWWSCWQRLKWDMSIKTITKKNSWAIVKLSQFRLNAKKQDTHNTNIIILKIKKCKRQIIHFGTIKNSSYQLGWLTFFFLSTHHIKWSRFTNHTVQKFFKVQLSWIGISWYIHYIFG